MIFKIIFRHLRRLSYIFSYVLTVLRPSINHLADSTFINETIVRTLDSEEVPVKDALNESCAFSENYSNIPVNTSDTIPQR